MTTSEALATAIHAALNDDRAGKGEIVYTYNDFFRQPAGTIGVDGDIALQELAKLTLAALDAAGFVIMPKHDMRPLPLLLDDDMLCGIVAHLTAGTADLAIVRLQAARMRAAHRPKESE